MSVVRTVFVLLALWGCINSAYAVKRPVKAWARVTEHYTLPEKGDGVAVVPAQNAADFPPPFVFDDAEQVSMRGDTVRAVHSNGTQTMWTRGKDGSWRAGDGRAFRPSDTGWKGGEKSFERRSDGGFRSGDGKPVNYSKDAATVISGDDTYDRKGDTWTKRPKR